MYNNSNRQATWNMIGTDISKASNVNEALQISGLDYKVVKEEIFLPDGTKINGHYATVQEGTDRTFGIVGDNYTIVQNEDAFAFVDSIIDEGLQFVKAGENDNLNYIIAKLPENYVLDDRFDPYIIFQNSHNGFTTLKATICPLRIVCQNQFSMAFRNADNKISLRHSSSIHDRLVEARRVLQISASYMDTFAKEAEELANIKVNPIQEMRIIDNLFEVPENATNRKMNTLEENRNFFMNILDSDDNQNFKGTAWGMINAYTDYITHLAPKRKTETIDMARFMAVTFDNKPIQNFRQLVMNTVA